MGNGSLPINDLARAALRLRFAVWDAVTRVAVLIEQKLRDKVGDKKQEEAFQVPVETPPSYLLTWNEFAIV